MVLLLREGRTGQLRALLLLVLSSRIVYAQTVVCPDDALIQPVGGQQLLLLPGHCTSQRRSSPIVLGGSCSIASSLGTTSTWNLQFAIGSYLVQPGAVVTLSNVVLGNATLSTKSAQTFIVPSFFSINATSGLPSASLTLSNVTIITTCDHVSRSKDLAATLAGMRLGPGSTNSLYVEEWRGEYLHARDVTITCMVPAQQLVPQLNATAFIIDSAADMMNALAAAQAAAPTGNVTLFLRGTITFGDLYASQADVQTWTIRMHVTVHGMSADHTVIDWDRLNWVLGMAPGATLTFTNVFMMNLYPLRGLVVPHKGYLPLYATPFWPVWPRADNQVRFFNATFLLSNQEYQYMVFWTAVFTMQLPVINRQAAEALRTNFDVQVPDRAQQSQDPDIVRLSRLSGNGIDATNLWITHLLPAGSSNVWHEPNTDVPVFTLDPSNTYPMVNQVGCYSVVELMAILAALEASPLDEGIAIILYRDMSLREVKGTWPVGGYRLRNPVYFVGKSTSNYTNWDMAMVPTFVTWEGAYNLPLFIYQNMINLPSTASASAAAFPCVPGGALVRNSTVVVPYAEFKALRRVTEGKADASTLPGWRNITVLALSATRVYLTGTCGSTYYDMPSDITYIVPPGGNYSLMYKNNIDPSSDSATEDDASLSTGAIIGIVIGSAVGGLLIAALLAMLVMRHRRQQPYVGQGKDSIDAEAIETERANRQSDNGSKAGAPGNSGGLPQGSGDTTSSELTGCQKPPIEELRQVMTTLASEINDKHLVILDVLGQGGFGTVYKGLWKGIVVAVKTITFQDKLLGGEKGQNTAIMEAAISSSILHPNVVATYSHDLKPLRADGFDLPAAAAAQMVTDWKLYIVQEYCDAGSLRQAILRWKFLDEKGVQPRMDLILDSALELVTGLAHLHGKNIIHGDLNPNNVLLKSESTSSRGFVCKLADFGLSIKMGDGQSHISNMRRGTPFYTAPEVMSKGNMTKAADTYSLGVMLWELLHSMMCYKTVANGGFEARSIFPSFPRECPPQYAVLATRCMAPEPTDRPVMDEVVQSVRSMIEGLSTRQLVWANRKPA